MNLRQAAEKALIQLQGDDAYLGHRSKKRADAIEALRQALAQPVDAVYISAERVHKTEKSIHEPVKWVGLTDYEIESELTKEFGQWWSRHVSVCRAIEAKLKEKNGG
jgi:16S rRNA C1402 (ribose-2'-O) methylase RsmI